MLFSKSFYDKEECHTRSENPKIAEKYKRILEAERRIDEVFTDLDLTYGESAIVLSNVKIEISKMEAPYTNNTKLSKMSPNNS